MILGIYIGAALVSLALCYPVLGWLKSKGVLDRPNDRSSHEKPTIRGGGIASLVVVLFVIGLWVCPEYPKLGYTWIGGLTILSWVSLRDDFGDVPISYRLLAQIIAVGLVNWALLVNDYSWGVILIAWFAMVAFINFVNFMDGVNGLVSGMIMLVALGLVWTFPSMNLLCKFVALALAGSVAGFLPFNFPKAKMFLGDVGSITLGFSTAVLILWIWTDNTTAPNQVLLPIFVLYFFLEGGVTLLRRMSAGEKWWKPHREHFYQRLIRSGYSHTRTTGLIISIQCLVILFIGGATLYKWPVTLSWVLSLLIWAGFFIYVEAKFRDTKEGSLPKL